MPLRSDSPEFHQLAMRWLDGLASSEEAMRLFDAIHACPECARVFAELSRFDLLLEQTSRELSKEGAVTAVAEKQTVRHGRVTFAKRTLLVAAMLALLGVLTWFVRTEKNEVVAKASPQKASAVVQQPVEIARRLLAPVPFSVASAKAATPLPEKPLPQVLDDFFLTQLSFDKVPLQQAILQMEAQLRQLNLGRRSLLDRLRIALPAEAARREVTFHSGAISFLKAVRALAGLADCDVNVSDQNVQLIAKAALSPPVIESRSVDVLLAQQSAESGTRLSEMIADARALGMKVDVVDGKLAGIQGTAAQFDALALMDQSRAQVRAMPPLPLVATTHPANPASKERVVSADELSNQQPGAVTAPIITLQPSSDVSEPTGASFAPGTAPADIAVALQPAGEGQYQLTIFHPAVVAAGSPQGFTPQEINVLLQPGSGVSLPVVNTATPGVLRVASPTTTIPNQLVASATNNGTQGNTPASATLSMPTDMNAMKLGDVIPSYGVTNVMGTAASSATAVTLSIGNKGGG